MTDQGMSERAAEIKEDWLRDMIAEHGPEQVKVWLADPDKHWSLNCFAQIAANMQEQRPDPEVFPGLGLCSVTAYDDPHEGDV